MLKTETARDVAVIEDDVAVRRLLEIGLRLDPRLSLAGSFPDARAALDAVDRGCPEAILLDLKMSGMSGLEALPLLRMHCPEAVIVIYTAYPEAAHEAIDLGADAVVAKADLDQKRLFSLLASLSRTV